MPSQSQFRWRFRVEKSRVSWLIRTRRMAWSLLVKARQSGMRFGINLAVRGKAG
jgi:hypothetical protein